MFKTNIAGQKRHKYVKNEFVRSVTFQPIVYIFIMYLVYLSIGTKVLFVFYLIFAIAVIYYIVFGIYAPIRLMKRQNRTISEIDFIDNEVVFNTVGIHWLKSKKSKVIINELSFKDRKFNWYGNIEKEGLSIIAEDIEFFLVKDFFDEYENIKKLIQKKSCIV
jgi:hypothetical protein